MNVAAGTQFGPYRVDALVGQGGMGQVYRGVDTRLDRTVAIKVLPAHLSSSPGFRERFDREARVISSLSHSNICTLFDVGRQDGNDFLVMEYLEGETLFERLQRGPLPLADALRYAIDICAALDKAHQHGVVHRDLKPGNVMLTKSGAKLLDFGLAKLSVAADANAATEAMNQALTSEGTILGTFGYMAPEQLEGREADSRSDIFALGAVLYEMVTGRRAFTGKSKASIIASILAAEPPAVASLQPHVPATLERLINACLRKDPAERWQSALDLKIELEALVRGEAAPVAAPRRRVLGAALILLLVAGAVALAAWLARRSVTAPSVRYEISAPPGTFMTAWDGVPLPSPDGSRILFKLEPGGLAVRERGSFDFRIIPDTQQAYEMAWSPDGNAIAYISDLKLRVVDLRSNTSRVLTTVPDTRGVAWTGDTILYSLAAGPVMKIAAAGGTATAVTALDRQRGETGHWRPSVLGDGKHFLYLANASDPDLSGVYVGTLDGKVRKRILDLRTGAVYADPGYVFYVRGSDLYVQEFDNAKLEARGEGTLVAPNIEVASEYSPPAFGVGGGTLAYIPRREPTTSSIYRMARNGAAERIPDLQGQNLDLSRDDGRLAFGKDDPAVRGSDVWTYDVARGVASRLTTDRAPDIGPVWSPDNRHILYVTTRSGEVVMLRQQANGAGAEDELHRATFDELLKTGIWEYEVTDWSRDGRYALVEMNTPKKRGDLGVVDLTSPRREIRPLVSTPFNERSSRFSWDGRWMSYESNESGRTQVYVQPFPPTGARWQISSAGGGSARWRRDGKELTFVDEDENLNAVSIAVENGDLVAGAPVKIGSGIPRDYVLSSDGQTVYFSRRAEQNHAPARVITNWMGLLPKKD